LRLKKKRKRKSQPHENAIKRCQEHATPASSDITHRQSEAQQKSYYKFR